MNKQSDSWVLGSAGTITQLGPPPMPPPPHLASRSPRKVRLIAGIAAFVVGSVGGFFGWRMLAGGFTFPEQVGGVPLSESGDASQLPFVRMTGLEGQVGFYGPVVDPTYTLVVLEAPGETGDTFWYQVRNSYPDPYYEGENFPDGAHFLCDNNPAAPEVGFCMWKTGDRIFELDAMSAPPEQIQEEALELYDQTSSVG